MHERTKIALLFEDNELGDRLRVALLEHGATIVHEGSPSQFGPSECARAQADVLVINLEQDNEDALDRLCALAEQTMVQLVFNDAQASRDLDGWDRARWARHLAVKAMASGDLDPPRPAATGTVSEIPTPVATTLRQARSHAPPPPDQTRVVPENLAAELESLLAAEALATHADSPVADDPRLAYEHKSQRPHDASLIDAMPPVGSRDRTTTAGLSVHGHAAPLNPATRPEPAPLSLLPPDERLTPIAHSAAPAAQREAVRQAIAATADWSLVELEATDVSGSVDDAAWSASGGPSSAPRAQALQDVGRLGALIIPAEGENALLRFLAALPMGPVWPLLLIPQIGQAGLESFMQRLADACAEPVALVASDTSIVPGCWWVLPPFGALPSRRDGRVQVDGLQGHAKVYAMPGSIDRRLAHLAETFGGELLVIFFADHCIEVTLGLQAIRDHGGRVWWEQTLDEQHVVDATPVLSKAEAVDFHGSPEQLAAHLIEVWR